MKRGRDTHGPYKINCKTQGVVRPFQIFAFAISSALIFAALELTYSRGFLANCGRCKIVLVQVPRIVASVCALSVSAAYQNTVMCVVSTTGQFEERLLVSFP